MHICGIGERKPREGDRDGAAVYLSEDEIGICEDCCALNDDLAAICFSDYNPSMRSEPIDNAAAEAAEAADAHPDYCGGPCTAGCGLRNDVYFAALNADDTADDTGIGAEADGVSANVAGYSANVAGYSANVGGYSANVAGYSANDAGFSANVAGYSANVGGYSANVAGFSANIADFPSNDIFSTNIVDDSDNISDDSDNDEGPSAVVPDYAKMAFAPNAVFPIDQQPDHSRSQPKRTRRIKRRPLRLGEYEPSTSDESRAGGRPRGDAQGSAKRQGAAGAGSGRQHRRKGPISSHQRHSRRMLSNERERLRMHGLNAAFQCLREMIPHVKRERRLSKIETLSLAKYYISSLIGIIIDMRTGRSTYFYASPEIENAVNDAYARGLVKFPRDQEYLTPRQQMDHCIYKDFIMGLKVPKREKDEADVKDEI